MSGILSTATVVCLGIVLCALLVRRTWLHRTAALVLVAAMAFELVFGIDSLARQANLEQGGGSAAFSERQIGVQILKEKLLSVRIELLLLGLAFAALVLVPAKNTKHDPESRS